MLSLTISEQIIIIIEINNNNNNITFEKIKLFSKNEIKLVLTIKVDTKSDVKTPYPEAPWKGNELMPNLYNEPIEHSENNIMR